ncbi:MAG TPA: LysR family transcriptional regulator [Polyangiaceae bacterium]|nr:LysR family transcriptional regulator [Polyangiaceae bacterium]
MLPAAPLSPAPCERADVLAQSFAASYTGVVAFLAVVSEGSFARAGDRLGVGRSAISRSVQKLEEQLGARLFFRTTRSTSLTREGELFYQNCRPGVERIVQALDGVRELREGPPRGRLRVSSSVGFGRKVVAPLLSGFQATYPDIDIDLLLDDNPADFSCDHLDIRFSDGRPERNQVIAKQLFPMQLLVCASPSYAAAHGLPQRVEDLFDHRCINYRLASGRLSDWEFKIDGKPKRLTPKGKSSFNDADLVLRAVLDGQGLAQLAGYQVSHLVRTGQLLNCLERYAPDDRGHYLCYLSRAQLPVRVRVYIDYMTIHARALLESSTSNSNDTLASHLALDETQ